MLLDVGIFRWAAEQIPKWYEVPGSDGKKLAEMLTSEVIESALDHSTRLLFDLVNYLPPDFTRLVAETIKATGSIEALKEHLWGQLLLALTLPEAYVEYVLQSPHDNFVDKFRLLIEMFFVIPKIPPGHLARLLPLCDDWPEDVKLDKSIYALRLVSQFDHPLLRDAVTSALSKESPEVSADFLFGMLPPAVRDTILLVPQVLRFLGGDSGLALVAPLLSSDFPWDVVLGLPCMEASETLATCKQLMSRLEELPPFVNAVFSLEESILGEDLALRFSSAILLSHFIQQFWAPQTDALSRLSVAELTDLLLFSGVRLPAAAPALSLLRAAPASLVAQRLRERLLEQEGHACTVHNAIALAGELGAPLLAPIIAELLLVDHGFDTRQQPVEIGLIREIPSLRDEQTQKTVAQTIARLGEPLIREIDARWADRMSNKFSVYIIDGIVRHPSEAALNFFLKLFDQKSNGWLNYLTVLSGNFPDPAVIDRLQRNLHRGYPIVPYIYYLLRAITGDDTPERNKAEDSLGQLMNQPLTEMQCSYCLTICCYVTPQLLVIHREDGQRLFLPAEDFPCPECKRFGDLRVISSPHNPLDKMFEAQWTTRQLSSQQPVAEARPSDDAETATGADGEPAQTSAPIADGEGIAGAEEELADTGADGGEIEADDDDDKDHRIPEFVELKLDWFTGDLVDMFDFARNVAEDNIEERVLACRFLSDIYEEAGQINRSLALQEEAVWLMPTHLPNTHELLIRLADLELHELGYRVLQRMAKHIIEAIADGGSILIPSSDNFSSELEKLALQFLPPEGNDDIEAALLWVRQLNARRPKIAKRKIGPNEPCPCGSGKKYKRCCKGKS